VVQAVRFIAPSPQLGRDVAIKVLRHDVATDPDRLDRFERKPDRHPRSFTPTSSPTIPEG
jgi:hypothetical protein